MCSSDLGATVVAGGAGYAAPTGVLYDSGVALSPVSFTVSAGAITGATLADPTQKASSNAYITITDGAGSGAVLAPQWTEIISPDQIVNGAIVRSDAAQGNFHPTSHSFVLKGFALAMNQSGSGSPCGEPC